MAMYPPLKFIEQMEGYFTLPLNRELEGIINNKAIEYFESYMKINRGNLYHDMISVRGSLDYSEELIVNKYNKLYNDFRKKVGIEGKLESIDDFLEIFTYFDIRNIWRQNKLAYILDRNLFRTLLDMQLPKFAPIYCLSNLPASCFYIDYNGMGNKIMQDLDGTFISFAKSGNEMNIVFTHLINSKKLSKKLLANSFLKLLLDDGVDLSKKFKTDALSKCSDTSVLCEDGITRVMHEGTLFRFMINFLVYLHASNRDVEISERTRQNKVKSTDTIKNKFREVTEYEVGFTYRKSISQNNKRIKYVGDKTKQSRGTSISSHYRSAHWHHYWTGSGENKKLIIKWVEGVMVNADKPLSSNVNVYKVK